ncbi:hypothetical protein AAC387_Pa08g1807 [Persea americana]
MKTQYGDFFSKDKLKNRFKTLKKTYADLKAMLDLSGFGWDDARKMVTAEPQVWKEYVAAHPKAAHYKNKTFPDWASLAIIFGDSVADGRDGFASNDPEPIETVVEEEKQPNDMNNARLYGTYGGVLSGGAVRERIIRAFLVEEQKIVKKDGSRGEKSKSRVRSRAVSRGNKSRSRAVSRGKRSESRVSRSQNRGRGRSVKSLKDSVAVKSKEEWSGTEDAEADSNESALN